MTDEERRTEADRLITDLLGIDQSKLSEEESEFIWLVSVGPIAEEEFAKLQGMQKRVQE